MQDVLTPEQAAEKLQVSRWTVYRWLREGKIPGRKMGLYWRIPADALMESLLGEPESNGKGEEYDDEPLSAQDWAAIRRGLDDAKAGRFVTLDEYEQGKRP